MRLIDADKIEYTEDLPDIFIVSRTLINKMPTVDAVEVVRCKDCKWFNPINNGDHGYCGTPFHGAEVYEDDYCSDGERAKE